ncbi:MAG: hypothetical protein QXS20_08500 [Candidatus Thorarchaeota archaeon]
MSTVPLRFMCPICKANVDVPLERARIEQAPRSPVPIVITHGTPEHAVTVFVDTEFRVRAISVSDIVKRIETVEAVRRPLSKRYVPIPKKGLVNMSDLDNTQVTVVALADGRRSVEELAQILGIPEMRVKIVCEQLVRIGRLDSVKAVIE